MLSLDNITRWPASFPGPSVKIQLSANPQQLHLFAFIPSTALSLMSCLPALSDCTVEHTDYSSHPYTHLQGAETPSSLHSFSLCAFRRFLPATGIFSQLCPKAAMMCFDFIAKIFPIHRIIPSKIAPAGPGTIWSAALGSRKMNGLPESLVFSRDGFS